MDRKELIRRKAGLYLALLEINPDELRDDEITDLMFDLTKDPDIQKILEEARKDGG